MSDRFAPSPHPPSIPRLLEAIEAVRREGEWTRSTALGSGTLVVCAMPIAAFVAGAPPHGLGVPIAAACLVGVVVTTAVSSARHRRGVARISQAREALSVLRGELARDVVGRGVVVDGWDVRGRMAPRDDERD